MARPMPRLPPVIRTVAEARAVAEESGEGPDCVMRVFAWARVLSLKVRERAIDFFLVRTTDLCDTHLNNIRGIPVFHRVCGSRMSMFGHSTYRSMDKYP
jgi:hypothetical protein